MLEYIIVILGIIQVEKEWQDDNTFLRYHGI